MLHNLFAHKILSLKATDSTVQTIITEIFVHSIPLLDFFINVCRLTKSKIANIVVKKKSILLNFLMMKRLKSRKRQKYKQKSANSKGAAAGVGTERVEAEVFSIEVVSVSAGEVDAEWLRFLEANYEEVVVY